MKLTDDIWFCDNCQKSFGVGEPCNFGAKNTLTLESFYGKEEVQQMAAIGVQMAKNFDGAEETEFGFYIGKVWDALQGLTYAGAYKTLGIVIDELNESQRAELIQGKKISGVK